MSRLIKHIPDGWKVKSIDEITTIGSGKDYKHLNKGSIPVYGTGGVMTFVDSFLYDGDSIGIGRKGTIDKPQYLTGKFWTVDTLFYTHSFKESKPKFLYYLFLTINWKLYNEASGVPSLSKKTIEKIRIPLPPLPEQQKIATILSKWDELIEVQTKLIEEKEKQKKGLMQKLLSGEVRFEGFEEEWEEKLLNEIATITTGSSNREDSMLVGEFTFFDRSQDIRTSSKYLFDKEAIIVPGEGQAFIPKYFQGKFDLHQRTYAIFDFNGIDGKFLFYYISKNDKYLLSQAVGSTVKSLRLPMFETMPILVPQIEEQVKIASTLTSCDDEIQTLKDELEAIQLQKKGLMQVLLTGRIRVKI